jgi:hypothetical protein
MRPVVFVILVIFGFIPVTDSLARSADSSPPHRHSQLVAQKIVELRGRLLREMVGLNDSRAREVELVLESFDDEHQTYNTMLGVAQRKMRSLLDEKSDDEKAYTQAVEDVRLAHDYLHQLRDRQFRAMQKILKPKEQALFFQSLGKLRHEVRKRMRRAKREAKGHKKVPH